jgi:hypothetical protein
MRGIKFLLFLFLIKISKIQVFPRFSLITVVDTSMISSRLTAPYYMSFPGHYHSDSQEGLLSKEITHYLVAKQIKLRLLTKWSATLHKVTGSSCPKVSRDVHIRGKYKRNYTYRTRHLFGTNINRRLYNTLLTP